MAHAGTPTQARIVLLLASTGCALTVLDTNVVGTILPMIGEQLQAGFSGMEWVITSYVLAFASLLLPAGTLADKFGRKRTFLFGITVFGIASIACGAAPTITTLIAARAVQGIGAACLIAPALAIIANRFTDHEERTHAWAFWGTAMGLTMTLSPLIGGWIGVTFGWRMAFYLNAPICLALVVLVPANVNESRDPTPRRLDLAGIALFVLGMLGITAALIQGANTGWHERGVLACAIMGAVFLAAFVAVEAIQQQPMLDIRLLKVPALMGAVVAMLAYAASAQVMASLLPLYLQGSTGASPLAAGAMMLPFALAMLVFPAVGRRLARRYASYQLLAAGLLLSALGNGWLAMVARNTSGTGWPLFAAMAVLGAGGGLLNGETQKAVMVHVPPERSGMASGISTTARFSGILVGFSVLGAAIAQSVRGTIDAQPHPGLMVTESMKASVVAGDFKALAGLPRESLTTLRLDFAHGFSAAFITAALAAGMATVVVWRTRHR